MGFEGVNKIPVEDVRERLEQQLETEEGLAAIKSLVEGNDEDPDNALTLATGWTREEMREVARDVLEKGGKAAAA
jgi:hypothetical protein